MKPNLHMRLLLPLTLALSNAEPSTSYSPSENKYPAIGAIPEPSGYRRILEDSSSFGSWLRNLPLRKDSRIFLYNGQLKRKQDMQFTVRFVCRKEGSSAVRRSNHEIKADYLKSKGRWKEIRFLDNNRTVYAPDGIPDNQHTGNAGSK